MRSRKRLLAVVITVGVSMVLVLLLPTANRTSSPGRLPDAHVALDQHDRILILAPHPDDEVIGCGGIIQQAVALGLPVHIGFLTYGDFYEWSFVVYKKRPVLTARGVEGMGEVRHDEAVAAASTLGLSKDDLSFLGYPDFGTLDMWHSAWGTSGPVRGILTKATAVPYKTAARPGAPYKGEEALKDLTSLIRAFRPTKVFVSHPADHHPDHRALYLFTRVSLFNLEDELSPDVYAYLVHYTDWPSPRGYYPDKPLAPPGSLGREVLWRINRVRPQENRTKLAAVKSHRTQYETTARYLNSFVRSNELFGDFPTIELNTDTPSHSGAESTRNDLAPQGGTMGQEDAFLVGVVERRVKIENGNLMLSMELTHPLAKEVGCSVYLFGYRTDRPFAEMPKLHIRLGLVSHTVHDQDREISPERIRVTRSDRHVEIRVPLQTIGNPEKILTAARVYAGAVPLDWTAWRILAIDAVNDTTFPAERP